MTSTSIRRWVAVGWLGFWQLAMLVNAADTNDLQRLLNKFDQSVKQRNWNQAERDAQYLLGVADEVLRNDPARLSGYYSALAKLYDLQERYDLAEPFFLKAAVLAHRGSGYWKATTAERYSELGNARWNQNKYLPAAEAYQHAVDIRTRILGGHLDTATSLRDLAWCYYKADDNEKAADAFERCLAIRKQQLGTADERVALSLYELANVYYYLARYDDALAAYQQALAIRTELQGAESADVAQTLLDKGDCLNTMNRLAEAEADYQSALAIREKLFGADAVEIGSVCRALGGLYYATARYDESYALYKRAVMIEERQRGPEDLYVARGLQGMAKALHELGRYAEAEPLYRRSLAIREQSGDELSIAIGCNNLAALFYEQSKYADGEPLYRRALKLREKNLEPDDPLVAESLSNLGALLRAQGRNREVEPIYQRALAIRQQKLAADDPDVAASLANLANLYNATSRYGEAEPLLLQALEINQKRYGDESYEVSNTLSNLASLRYNQGQTDEARELYQRVLTISESRLGRNHPTLASRLYDIAWCSYYADQFEDTIATLDRAADIVRQAAVDPQTSFSVFNLRAKANWKLDRRAEALSDLNRAMDLADRQRGQSSGAELERAAYFSRFTDAYERMVAWQCELGDLNQALSAIERCRARSLLDEIGLLGSDIDAGRTSVDREQLREAAAALRTQQTELEQQLEPLERIRNPTVEQIAERDRLDTELAAVQDQLYQSYREARTSSQTYQNLLHSGWSNTITPALTELQRQLIDEKTQLLMYFIGQENGYVLSIEHDKATLEQLAVDESQAGVLGCDAGPLTEDRLKVIFLGEGSFLRQLQNPKSGPELRTQLAALWNLLIPEQHRATLTSGDLERLYIIPNGPLAFLPFETLVTTTTPELKYLLDVGPSIQYAPSVTVLDSLRIRPEGTVPEGREPVLTVGNPQYRTTNQAAPVVQNRSRRAIFRSQLMPLPYSGLESQWVTDVFKRYKITTARLNSTEASEERFRASATNRRLIHLACHGFADQEHGNLFGALALAGTGDRGDPGNDGFLSLAEIYDLDLRGCELAILSACETNFGPDQQGEGVWALSRGFLVAGARRVVASDWVVDDEAAASLVSYYCGGLAKAEQSGTPAPYGPALQAAKRWIRSQKKWEAPYYWASLVLVGPP